MITISNPEKYVAGILVRLSNEKIEDLKRCGESGAFYDSPGFVEMINDVEEEHINMVVVKDLSRFGRVVSGIDDYIEEYFQIKGVRFVAVNENLDSKTSANFHNDIKIRAFFNEWFLRDCSKNDR